MSEENTVEVTSKVATDATAVQKRSRKKYNVDGKAFVEAWQSSTSAQEAADKLGMPKNIVQARYALYKSRGVDLKRMDRPSPRKLDVEGLNALIKGA